MLLSLWETYPEISDFAEVPLREFPSFSWIGTHRSTLTLKKQPTYIGCFLEKRQRPTFPGSLPPSIISAKELNFCVRYGNRCDLLAIVTAYSCSSFHPATVLLLTRSSVTYLSMLLPLSLARLASESKSIAILFEFALLHPQN